MNKATWYAILHNGEKIIENSKLPKKGLLNLDTTNIKEFGAESKIWQANFSINGTFFFNNRKIESALPNIRIKNFKIVYYNKVVLNNLANDARRDRSLVLGYRTENEESILIISSSLAYLFLRKRRINNKWIFTKNKEYITESKYNLILYF